MKLFFLTFMLLVSGSLTTLAQTENSKTADWKTFAPEKEEFSIETPVSLNETKIPVPDIPPGLRDQENADDNRRYQNALDGTYFYIFSDDWQKPKQFRFVLDFANSQDQFETSRNSGDLPTQKFEFSDDSNFYHTILSISGKNRIYVFHTVSPSKENPLVERFFASLKFNGKSLAENVSNTRIDKEVSVTVPLPEPEVTNVPPTVVTGISGNRTPPGEKTPSPTPNAETTGVKILTKPRAIYTNFARFYEMTGKVLLRVTFQANGTIGSITVLSKLPFGLTQAAVTAARGIAFEPARRGGVPYSVTKPVEYTFTMY